MSDASIAIMSASLPGSSEPIVSARPERPGAAEGAKAQPAERVEARPRIATHDLAGHAEHTRPTRIASKIDGSGPPETSEPSPTGMPASR